MESQAEGKIKILDAALTEFAAHGFAGARIDRIASAAGVNKALIYYHFKNKEELYAATLDYLFTKVSPYVMNPKGKTVQAKLLHMVGQFLRFLHENPVFVRMLDLNALRNVKLNVVLENQMLLWKSALDLYQAGVANGELRDLGDPTDYIIAVLGACHFFYSQSHAVRSFYGGDRNPDDLLDTHIRTMQDIISRVFFINPAASTK